MNTIEQQTIHCDAEPFTFLLNRTGAVLFAAEYFQEAEVMELVESAFHSFPVGHPAARVATSGGPQRRVSRGGVSRVVLQSGSAVILRPCYRGGWFGKVVRESFLASPTRPAMTLRPFQELLLTHFVWKRGCRVPRPVLAAVRYRAGKLLYRSVHVTEEIAGGNNFLEVIASSADKDALRSVSRNVGFEAARLLSVGVLHTDLHLGNVLVPVGEQPVIIDLDAARFVTPPAGEKEQNQLIERWSRSAIKHNLFGAIEPFREGLRAGMEQFASSAK